MPPISRTHRVASSAIGVEVLRRPIRELQLREYRDDVDARSNRAHGAVNPLVVTAQDELEQRALPCQHAPDDFHVRQRIVEFWFYSGGHVMLPSL